jgi:hypothetical protein
LEKSTENGCDQTRVLLDPDPSKMDKKELIRRLTIQLGNEREARKLASKLKRGKVPLSPPKLCISIDEVVSRMSLSVDQIRINPEAMSAMGVEDGARARVSFRDRMVTVTVRTSTMRGKCVVELGEELKTYLEAPPGSEISIAFVSRSPAGSAKEGEKLADSKRLDKASEEEDDSPSHEAPFVVEKGFRFWKRKG